MADEPLSGSRVFMTPNLEKLASQGMTFSQAYAAHWKCECSRAAIQMGRTTTLNAPDKQSRNWSAPVTDSFVNTLKKAEPSYRAAHFGKWQWFHTPESMGYDASDGITTNEDDDTTDPEDTKEGLLFDLTNELGETRNIAKQKPEIAAKFETDLKAHVRTSLSEHAFAALEKGEFTQGRPKGKKK